MRLDRFLQDSQNLLRHEVKRLLKAERVIINDQVVTNGSMNVDGYFHRIELDGQHIDGPKHTYIMMNKPIGVLTANSDAEHTTMLDILPDELRQLPGIASIGRLDRNTSGLLLLSDNGPFVYRMTQADKEVDKTYRVIVNELVTQEDVQAFAEGITFHGGITCRSSRLEIIKHFPSLSWSLVEVTISQGYYHQIKKMFLARGKKVNYLERIAIGYIRLDAELPTGSWRHLSNDELDLLAGYQQKDEKPFK